MTKNARVSEEKRARVEAVIRKYDYRPNALAQGLIKTKTNVIGVLAADLVNPYYSSMVENCEKEIIARGYVPMICGTLSNPDLEVDIFRKCLTCVWMRSSLSGKIRQPCHGAGIRRSDQPCR